MPFVKQGGTAVSKARRYRTSKKDLDPFKQQQREWRSWTKKVDRKIDQPFNHSSNNGSRWTLKLLHVFGCLHRSKSQFMKNGPVSYDLDASDVYPFNQLEASDFNTNIDLSIVDPDEQFFPTRYNEMGRYVSNFETVKEIVIETKLPRETVARMLKRAEKDGLVAKKSKIGGNSDRWMITEAGEKVLWAGIAKRVSRRNEFLKYPDYYDPLNIVRDVRKVSDILKNGLKNGTRAFIPDYDGEQKYWNSNLRWEVLRAVPIRAIQRLIYKARDRARHFFAYTYGVLLGGKKSERIAQAQNRKPRRLCRRVKEYRRVHGIIDQRAVYITQHYDKPKWGSDIIWENAKVGSAIEAAFTMVHGVGRKPDMDLPMEDWGPDEFEHNDAPMTVAKDCV